MKQSNKLRSVILGSILLILAVFQMQIINVYAQEPSCKSWLSYDPDARGKICTQIYQNCPFWIHFQNTNTQQPISSITIQILKSGKIVDTSTLNCYTTTQSSGHFILSQIGNYVLRRSAVTTSGKTLKWTDKTLKVLSVKKCGAGISVSPTTLYLEAGKSKLVRVKHTGMFQQYSGRKTILPERTALGPQNIDYKYATYSFAQTGEHDFTGVTDIIFKGVLPGTTKADIVYRDDISGEIIDKKTVKIIVTKKSSVSDNISVSANINKVYTPGKQFSLNAHATGKLSYTSSDKRVATVSSTGMVTMKGYGTTTIVVSLSDYSGNKITSKKVKVSLTPAKTSLINVAFNSLGKTMVSWRHVSNAQGYQIQCSLSKSFPSVASQTQNGYIRNLKTSSKYKKDFSILKRKKTWYIRIRAYRKVNGHEIYGPWSNVKSIFIK